MSRKTVFATFVVATMMLFGSIAMAAGSETPLCDKAWNDFANGDIADEAAVNKICDDEKKGGGSTCGNGVTDAGEQCDEPGLACSEGHDCKQCKCTPKSEPRCGVPGKPPCGPTCGNGVTDAGEQCGEPGLSSCGKGYTCKKCKCKKVRKKDPCGNGKQDQGEQCGEPGLQCEPTHNCEKCICVPKDVEPPVNPPVTDVPGGPPDIRNAKTCEEVAGFIEHHLSDEGRFGKVWKITFPTSDDVPLTSGEAKEVFAKIAEEKAAVERSRLWSIVEWVLIALVLLALFLYLVIRDRKRATEAKELEKKIDDLESVVAYLQGQQGS